MWLNKRETLQNYFQLTEILSLPTQYKQQTGKDYIYNGYITLNYIKWIYQQKPEDLKKFMKELYPVL